MKVTYKDGYDSLIKTKYVIGEWWPVNYLSQPYSSDPSENQKMTKLSPEELLKIRIIDGGEYKVVNEYETAPIKTKLNGTVRFPFLIVQGEVLSHSNVGIVIRTEKLKIGCTAWPRILPADLKEMLLFNQPTIAVESDDTSGGEATYYRLRYNLGNESKFIYFFYGYEGGCA